MLFQAAYQQQRLRRPTTIAPVGRPIGLAHDGSLMSIALRSPSLSRLKHSEVIRIATPGSAATSGLTKMAWRNALSIRHHAGLGGVTPSPRKESPAERIMLMLTRLVA